MQGTLMRRDSRRASAQRIAVFVVVTGVHLGLVLLLLRAPRALPRALRADATAARDVLRIRVLPRKPLGPAPAPAAVALPRPRHPPTIKAPTARAPVPRLRAPAAVASPMKVELGSATSNNAGTYIAGGGLLDGAPSNALRGHVHLPGSSEAIMQGLHMVDPRSRGFGGAVRAVQTVFGVPDAHCVNVDGWRGMTIRELLDRHMSPDQVEKTAEKFHCGPPR